jgi:uncharacterized membrane protein (DUF485 family)
MATETPAPPAPPDEGRYRLVQDSSDFGALRSSFRGFVFPTTVAFLVWYGLYVVLSVYARGFMGTKVVGHINIALVFGLLQFVSTFVLAWLYARFASRRLDPASERLREQLKDGDQQ